jgi:ABC-type siderophore export system fused ATPase/permease subunit
MNEVTVFIICLISMVVSVASLYVAIRTAKNLVIAHQNIEVLHQVLLDMLHQQDQDEYYQDEYETPANPFNKNDKVIDLFSRQALEWDADLKEWIPKIPDDLDEN